MKKNTLILSIIALIAITSIAVYSYTQKPGTPSDTTDKSIKVVASFYPLADFAQQIGGQYVEVINITPPGIEPHDFEPTPQDIASIYNADVFIINGLGVDAWAEKIIPQLESKNITIVRMSDYLANQDNSDPDSTEVTYDPHFWLDPITVVKEADIITRAFIKIDTEHTKEYNQNNDAFQQKLKKLDEDYQLALIGCPAREIVTTHDAFGYLANRYNLTTFTLAGLSPDIEPSPKKVAEIIRLARDFNIKYIFFEAPADKKISETIANELGIQTLVLNPIEQLTDAEIEAGEDYESKMRQNLQNLKTALLCP